jgi:methylthioribose-1-phosphate isomerase
MLVGKDHYRSIWVGDDPGEIRVIDQRKLPHEFEIARLENWKQAASAISDMVVRGAPLIGVTAAFGLYLAALESNPDQWCNQVREAAEGMVATRPTAVNLEYAVNLATGELDCSGSRERCIERLFHLAVQLAEQEVRNCRKIGEHGLPLIRECFQKKQDTVHILTHCNAGWLACVDYGTATAPIYMAHDQGTPVHVWVDETRPRNQGARLTAWELGQHGIPHTVVVDNAGGQLMQQGRVDLVLVGSDRTTRTGDVANKIGTYLKALAAKDNGIPFYVALPSSSIDMEMDKGEEIPIEYRDNAEVTHVWGWNEHLKKETGVRIVPELSEVSNPGFDITPARLVNGLITEKGIISANEKGISSIFSG